MVVLSLLSCQQCAGGKSSRGGTFSVFCVVFTLVVKIIRSEEIAEWSAYGSGECRVPRSSPDGGADFSPVDQ